MADGIQATDLLPARYDEIGAKGLWQQCAEHLLEDIDPGFAGRLRPGDLIVAGAGLGGGHSHYYRAATLACRAAGIGAILADGVIDLFHRGAIDQGLPVLTVPDITSFADNGDRLRVNLREGWTENLTKGAMKRFKPLAPVILDILAAGSAFEWAKARASSRVS